MSQASAAPAEATFNFTYGYKTAANTVSAVNYTDDAGTSLKVSARSTSRSLYSCYIRFCIVGACQRAFFASIYALAGLLCI